MDEPALASEEETPGDGERLLAESLANSSQHDLMSPEPRRPQSLVLEQLPHLLGRIGQGSPSPPSPVSSLLPDLEEIRVSPCIAKKGHLNVLEEKSKGWKKRWVVVRRPYVFIFRDERLDNWTYKKYLSIRNLVQGPLRESFDKLGNSKDRIQSWRGSGWRFPFI